MCRTQYLKSAALAVLALAAAGPALAGNTIKLDISGTGKVTSLAISQDATGSNNTNTITTTGAAGGAQIPVRGKWASLSITQIGAGNQFKSAGLTSTAAAAASLSLTYGTGITGGNNIHSLTIGANTAPATVAVTGTVVNSDPDNAANTITDALDGSSVTYALDIDGTNNTVTDTVNASGANTLSLTLHGGTAASGNTVLNTVTGATSSNITVAAFSNGNSITNLSNGSGDKTFSVTLPSGGTNGNTVLNDFTGGSGTQSSSLLVNGVTSKVNYALTAAGATTSSSVTLTDVVGAASAAAKLALTQSGANASLILSVNGNGFTMGSSLGTGADTGVLITQASSNAVLNANINAAANGYTYSISQ